MSTMGNDTGSTVAPKSRRKLLFAILGATLLTVVVIVAATLGTARYWEVVDRPEQPETFSTQEFETGTSVVIPDMTRVSLCSVGQDWDACVALMVKEFDGACTGGDLTKSSARFCDDWRSWIQKEKKQNSKGYTVSSADGFEPFVRYALTDFRRVSNDDYRAAETHQAVCYLGFLGECEDKTDADAQPVNEEYETGVYMIVADGKDFCGNSKAKDCYAAVKAEYERTCGTVEKTDVTEASWNICRGAANELRDKPTKKGGEEVGSFWSAFGHLTKVPVTAVRPATTTHSQPSDPGLAKAEKVLREALKSPETEKMRATYKEELARGKTQDDLVSEIKKQMDQGLILAPTACVFLGLVYDIPDEVIVEDCRSEMAAVLNGTDTESKK